MAREGFANTPTPGNPSTPWSTLGASLSSGATAVTITAHTSFPQTTAFWILVGVAETDGTLSNAERMHVTAGAGSTSWTVTRSVAVAHASGEAVYHVLTAEGLAANPGPMTTAGDFTYLNASLVPARLGAPANGAYNVTWASGVPSWTGAVPWDGTHLQIGPEDSISIGPYNQTDLRSDSNNNALRGVVTSAGGFAEFDIYGSFITATGDVDPYTGLEATPGELSDLGYMGFDYIDTTDIETLQFNLNVAGCHYDALLTMHDGRFGIGVEVNGLPELGPLISNSNLYIAGDGTLTHAKGYLQSTSGYKSTDGTAGVTTTGFKNGLLTEASSLVPTSRTVNGHALSANVTVTAADVGLGSVENAAASDLYVPVTRTVNGSALSSNVTISTISGNAGTATALATARAINGVNFDGTGAITVTAAAGTLSGATLAAGVTASSLTSFGAAPALGAANATSIAAAGLFSSTQAIAAVSTDGLLLTNTTAATVGAQKWSPRLHFTGQGWKTTSTAGSQTVDFIAEVQPVQGAANPTANLVWSSQINGAGYNARMTLSDVGGLALSGNLTYTGASNANFFGLARMELPDYTILGAVAGLGTASNACGLFNSSANKFVLASNFIFGFSSTATAGTNYATLNTNMDTILARGGAAVLQLGSDVNGLAVAQTLQSCNGITGTDKAGATFTIASGKGTGAGAVSALFLQTPTALGSGTTAQSLTTRLTVDANGIKATGYLSSDGSAGVTAGPFTTITGITVKNGLVTALTGA